MDKIEVNLSGSYKTVMWIVGLCTFGVGALGMWFSARCWPKIVDRSGITLRNGKKVEWADITGVDTVSVVNNSGRRVTGRLELKFSRVTVKIVPQSLAEGATVMAFVDKILGEIGYNS